MASQVALVIKNLADNGGNIRDWDWRCFGGRHGNPLQYSCLENPMEGGAWQAICGVAQSRTRLK